MERITVFIPAYNAEKWLGHAIESVLAQTYQNFHLLVIDDGSSDGTAALARSYADTRVTVISNPQNLGIAETRNKALRICTTRWLACLDADDIALPERLERQVEYLLHNPDTVVLGGQGEYFGDASGPARYPVGHRAVSRRILFDNPFMQNTVVLDVEWLKEHKIQYNPSALYCEDYDFWAQIYLAGGAMLNLADCLVKYRVHSESASRSRRQQQEASANIVRRRLLQNASYLLDETQWRFLDRYQFEGKIWADRQTRRLLRSLANDLNGAAADPYELVRFLCSALPRPVSLLDKVLLALTIVRTFGKPGIDFVAGYLTGKG
jgi:glycosyltransferase involved in cell wall biosynthesis